MEPVAKGQTLKSLVTYMQSVLTPAELEHALASLAPEERKQIERGILATSTFPMTLVNKLTIEGARAANKPLQEFARDAGRFSANEGVKGVYRLFARVLTVEALLGKAAMMWSSMNSAGTMQMIRSGDRSAVLRLSNYPSERVMCMRISGWIEQLGALAGAKNTVVTHSQCVSTGAAACEWHLTW